MAGRDAELPAHHTVGRESAVGVWEPARPERDSVRPWVRERACRIRTGHCYHPEGLVDWWCCMCGRDEQGMPEQKCVYCVAKGL